MTPSPPPKPTGSITTLDSSGGPSLTAVDVSAVESDSFTANVATVSDSGSWGVYVQVNWGDGSSSYPEFFDASSGGGTVSSTHTYAESGTFDITISAFDSGGGQATAHAAAHVADKPLTVAATSATINALTRQTVSPDYLAKFTDTGFTYPDFSDGGEFQGTVDWGDGTVETGPPLVTDSGGGMTVGGSHAYAKRGIYAVKVTALDKDGKATATTGFTIVVRNPVVTISAGDQNLTEGQALSGAIASISGLPPGVPMPPFTVTINWGDGTAGAGSLSGVNVVGSHTYVEAGNHAVTVKLYDDLGLAAVGGFTAHVADAALSVQSNPYYYYYNAPEGATTPLAFSFADANPFAGVGDFLVSINWGDGTPDQNLSGSNPGSITSGSLNGQHVFNVSGSHVYKEDGWYPATVTVTDREGSRVIYGAQAYSQEVDPQIQGVGALHMDEGAFSSQVLGAFSNLVYPGDKDMTATIDWGDGDDPEVINLGGNGGTPQSATVVVDSGGHSTLTGGHAYTEDGSFPVTITVRDEGHTYTYTETAIVREPPLSVTAEWAYRSWFENDPTPIGRIGSPSLIKPDPDMTASVTWFDGVSSKLGIDGNDLTGEWRSFAPGSYAYTLTVTDESQTVTAQGTLVVPPTPIDPPPPPPAPAPLDGYVRLGTAPSGTPAGIVGVNVTLMGKDDRNNNVILRTTSDTDGHYVFWPGPGFYTGPAHLILGISAQYSLQVALVPGGPQPLPLDAPLRRGLLFQQAQRQPSQQAEVLRGVLLLDPAPVFVERHIQDPMQRVLHPPMATDRIVQELGVIREAAEVIPRLHAQRIADESLGLDHHHAPQALPLLPARQPVEVRGGPAPPGLGPAVPLGPLPVVGDVRPLHPTGAGTVPEPHDLLEEVLVVGLQRQDVVGLPAPDRAGDLFLAAHGVDRHDRPGDLQHFQELGDRRDLVGLLVHGHLTQ